MTPDFAAFVADTTADPGRRRHRPQALPNHDGMTTRHLDHDLYVILVGDAAGELAASTATAPHGSTWSSPPSKVPPTCHPRAVRHRPGRVLVDRRDGEVA